MRVEGRESSVVVSLSEILRLEERRSEEEAAVRREAAERQAAADVEALARAADEERRRASELQARAEAIADREREARLEMAREAELARVRHEVAAATRMKELSESQEHERRLAVLKGRARTTWLGGLAYSALALLATTWTVGGWYEIRSTHRMNEERASRREASAAQTSAYERLWQEYREERDEVGALEKKLADLARSDGPSPPELPRRAPSNMGAPAPGRIFPVSAQVATPAAHLRCKEGDPLCPDIP